MKPAAKPKETVAHTAPAGQKAASARKPASLEGKASSASKSATAKPEYQLRLYVAGNTARSAAALENLRTICETHLPGRYVIEVIDLMVNPKLAAGDQILAVPTLVRKFPEPLRKIIGDLSNTERVLVGLDVRPLN